MKITDLLKKDSIDLNVEASNKEEVLKKAVELMNKNGNITDKDKYLELVMKREEEGSTGIGEEIAIPHGKDDSISAPGLAAMVIPNGVDFEALDGKPVKLFPHRPLPGWCRRQHQCADRPGQRIAGTLHRLRKTTERTGK